MRWLNKEIPRRPKVTIITDRKRERKEHDNRWEIGPGQEV